jgi:Domain of unknown function (DUF4381)
MSDPADLSNLRDIVVPPDVPLWPPAPGWWILAAGCVAAGAILIAMAVARYRQNAYRRQALLELERVEACDISTVLKRAALVAWPRAQVASLSGEEWRAFLDRSARMDAFTRGAGRDLEALAFGGAGDAPGVLAAAKTWIRRHRC